MRCEDLTRELASPTGALSPDEMAGHLAECAVCDQWSRQAARFDQVWEATRPAGPSSVMLDTLWASASAALEAQPTLRLEGVPATRRRSWIKPAFIFAQAAAILLAVGFYLNHKGAVEPIQTAQTKLIQKTQPTQVAIGTSVVPVPPAEIPTFDIVANDGETPVVSIPNDATKAAPKVKWLKANWPEHTNSIPADAPIDIMNAAETMLELTKL